MMSRQGRVEVVDVRPLAVASTLLVALLLSCSRDAPEPAQAASDQHTTGQYPAPSERPEDATDSVTQLSATSWVLNNLDGRAWSGLANGRDVTLTFDDHRLGGFGGCNTYAARWRMSGARVEVGKITSTLVGCRDAAAWVEDRLLAVVSTSPTVRSSGVGVLRLSSPVGSPIFAPIV